jgi:hypothetical protein
MDTNNIVILLWEVEGVGNTVTVLKLKRRKFTKKGTFE